ncbi:hypothetical protein F511_01021 [Dorcoceras hygrometricum]|uniref:Homeobox domain-containing protein n=1 Tax=Dorcoceras hygrometricum TaxID=472368 RepID=A0A2Z7AM27_9LAMI|nr:hypothetical protein F511_01021 [Dorcoceras hygrometricum]
MRSEDSPSNSNSSILHQFLVSNSIAAQNQYENQHFVACGTQSDSLPLDIQSLGERMPRSVDLLIAPQLSDESDLRQCKRSMNLLETSAAHRPQRLSLSLGSVMDPGYIVYNNTTSDCCFAGTGYTFIPSAALGSSKYLKPAQSLLEEMVSIGSKEIDISNKRYVEKLSRSSKIGSSNEELSEKPGSCVHLLKLLALLQEVERRYEEYYIHMEELVSCFETIAGVGAGKSYTALALQAMSKHFCILRNATLSQIRAMKRKMEANMPRISSRLVQLSLLDQESRHNRNALQLQQQLGITHSWRLVRGLPENSLMILRAWLFEHFLHPYPNDSEKLVLASQTGLSKNQVSNWFINARVRLWKPMIEQMYKEEFGGSSIESDEMLTTSAEGTGNLS